MTRQFRGAFILVLLAVTGFAAPADAAIIQWNLENVTLGNYDGFSNTTTGFFDYDTNTHAVTNWNITAVDYPDTAYFTPSLGSATVYGTVPYYGYYGFSFSSNLTINDVTGLPASPGWGVDLIPLNPLDGSVADVSLDSNYGLCPTGPSFCAQYQSGAYLEATPLPPALPMFGAALLALAAFAWRRKGHSRA